MEKVSTLILLNIQAYQAPESVMINQRVHYFLDLGLSYFYRIKEIWRITAEYLQWTIYKMVYTYLKKIDKKLSRPSNPSLGK